MGCLQPMGLPPPHGLPPAHGPPPHKPGPRGAEATLGAPASPLGQPFGSRGQPVKARLPPKVFPCFLTFFRAPQTARADTKCVLRSGPVRGR